VLVLVVLRGGTHRFSELRRKIGGISEKMLARPCRRWSTTALCAAWCTR
jgi:DNA-binding HxlR family transcriptional regulator